jgi:hypothetical protein
LPHPSNDKRIILHIGTPKTGTTAIQSYLFANRAVLASNGVLYPMTGLQTKDEFGPRHKGLTHRNHENARRWRKLRTEIKESPAPTAIISCEAFWRYPERAQQIRDKFAHLDFEIIVYLRRQDRMLASWHAHTVKHYGPISSPEFWHHQKRLLEYDRLIEQREAAFEKIIVRPYCEGENVIPDFMSSLNLPLVPLNDSFKARTQGNAPDLEPDLATAVLAACAGGNYRLMERYPQLKEYF